jgi:hypothetical protein
MYIVKIKKMLRVVLEYRKNGNGMKTLAKRWGKSGKGNSPTVEKDEEEAQISKRKWE